MQSMDLAPVPPGLLRCKFLAVGSFDQVVRVLSLEDGTQLRAVATQAVNVSPGGGCGRGGEFGIIFGWGLRVQKGVLSQQWVGGLTDTLCYDWHCEGGVCAVLQLADPGCQCPAARVGAAVLRLACCRQHVRLMYRLLQLKLCTC